MKTLLFSIALFALVPSTAAAGDNLASFNNLVSFNGGIGVDPVAGATGTAPDLVVVLNAIRGVNPPADPWRIARLNAAVNTDGNITVSGSGFAPCWWQFHRDDGCRNQRRRRTLLRPCHQLHRIRFGCRAPRCERQFLYSQCPIIRTA